MSKHGHTTHIKLSSEPKHLLLHEVDLRLGLPVRGQRPVPGEPGLLGRDTV